MGKKVTEGTITIKDIASKCNVSISTVSNVLNGKTNKVSEEIAKKILSVIEETGYKPNYLAKNLRSLSTRTIGVIAEDLIVFSASSMIEGIMRMCEERGYNVIIENMRLFGRWSDAWMKDEALFQSALQPVLTKMDSINVDGIVYVGGHEHSIQNISSANNSPIVMCYANSSNTSIPSFRLDDYSGGYDAFTYLINKGHTKIGVIAGEPDNTHTINRVQGLQKAAFDAGILFDPDLIRYQHWNKEGGYEGMKELVDKDLTAVFCMSDNIAAGAYACLKEHNLEPGKDIAIMGYDNQDISCFLTPMVTTVALPLEDIGYEATKKLIDMVENGTDTTETCDVRIKGTLISRESA